MSSGLTLICPIRGRLKAKARSKDGLTPSEERFRVDAIRHLIRSGYPKEHFVIEAVIKRFGNSGRSSFRADFAVLDVPAAAINTSNPDEVLEHALLLAEIKRDNADAANAAAFQVKPMLDFAVRSNCVALYWDNVEQRVYWLERNAGVKQYREAPLADLPPFGGTPGVRPLTFATIDDQKPLLGVFARIEDILHASALGPMKRFTVMLQLLLAKLHDEHEHQERPETPLTFQDFSALSIRGDIALSELNRLLAKAVGYYQTFLPEPIPAQFFVNGETLVEISKVLAPTKIVSMKRSVIQDFYMYFARHIYKWDLAQYFTPTSLTEFIVEVLNPGFAEHVKDPACGSADFLTAAFRRGQARWPNYASNIWGSDISAEAVQVATLNMILNGDGRSNIRREDSLATIRETEKSTDIVICNPPFGTRIVERNKAVLSQFDMGYEWGRSPLGGFERTNEVLETQESGILFAEACVRMLRPGGRMALVVPNGYLGNRSIRYSALREWILRHCRVMVIVALPRFTFKGSGADVSASIIFCEKRPSPLSDSSQDGDYDVCVEIIDRVGWMTGDKKAAPLFRRDQSDGTFLLDEEGQLIPDSDFDEALRRIRTSDAAVFAPWLTRGLSDQDGAGGPGWTVPITDITADSYRTLDPKRLCRKFAELRAEIRSREFFAVGDVVRFIPERTSSWGTKLRFEPSRVYRHVEIQDVETGSYRWHERRGWELPQRARHLAEPGDIFVGGIRNSVRKWFLVGREATDLVVTNGMHRMRVKAGKEEYLLDLVVGLCSEAYRVQMRGLARGADGLAEIASEDVEQVLLPRITDASARTEIWPFLDQLLSGQVSIDAMVNLLLTRGRLPLPRPRPQPDHTALL
ncbi:HsdM family class I SAM-dependent methyltransferase [Micromonospora coxensis]|uniref:Type I restriction enzyme M protein n=1 Tax=Micromonospora coxensis TaxID=356852 RepID=A0A1C5IYI0_9ACTN|nr:N-6 DNA methylase [Micromonospora coxensis]SCG63364.1 type I restriction enzyme M protein [Micromonospora coxensis]